MRIAITGASGNAGTALLRRLQTGQPRPGGLDLVGISRRTPDASTGRLRRRGVARRWTWARTVGQDAIRAPSPEPTRWCTWRGRSSPTGTLQRCTARMSPARQTCWRQRGKPAWGTWCAPPQWAPTASRPRTAGWTNRWPAGGMTGSHYSRHKAEQEAALDRFAADNPSVAVARLRPGLIFQRRPEVRSAGTSWAWVHPRFVPAPPGLAGIANSRGADLPGGACRRRR